MLGIRYEFVLYDTYTYLMKMRDLVMFYKLLILLHTT